MSKFLNSGLIKLYAPADDNGSGAGGEGAGAEGAGGEGDAGHGDMYGAGDAGAAGADTKKKEGEDGGNDGQGAEGGEGGEGDEDDGLSEGERELMKELEAEGKKAADDKKAAAPAAPGAVKLDSESISQITNALKPQSAGGAEKMDQAEVAKLLNPVVVTEDTLKSLGFTEPTKEQVAGFQTFANATVKNAVSIARILIQNEAKKFEEFLAPISSHIQTQQAEGAKQEFFSTFPSLKAYDGIVKAAALEVSATKPDGSQKTRQEIFKEVAARAMRTLRSSNIQIGKTAPSANHNAGSGVGKPNAFPGPGRSGGSGPTGGKNNADADIYSR